MSEHDDGTHPEDVHARHPALRAPRRARCARVSDERLDLVFTATPGVDLVAVSPRTTSPGPSQEPHSCPAPPSTQGPTRGSTDEPSDGASGGDLPASVRLVDAETAGAIAVLAATHGVGGPNSSLRSQRPSVDELVEAAEAELTRNPGPGSGSGSGSGSGRPDSGPGQDSVAC